MRKNLPHVTCQTLASLAIIGTLLVGACSYAIKVKVLHLPNGMLEFRLERESAFGGPAELNSFSVFEYSSGDWDYKHPVWAFDRPKGSYLKVSRVPYGSVPEGFNESTKAQPLVLEKKYLAVAFGAGSSGSAEFKVEHK